MTIIYITCKDIKEAKKISKHLLNKRIIACANIHPIESMYWWKGKIVEELETVIIAKSSSKNFNKIKEEVKKIHSYEIPCILKIDSEANEGYDEWVRKEIR